jgi:hypothetical protein
MVRFILRRFFPYFLYDYVVKSYEQNKEDLVRYIEDGRDQVRILANERDEIIDKIDDAEAGIKQAEKLCQSITKIVEGA